MDGGLKMQARKKRLVWATHQDHVCASSSGQLCCRGQQSVLAGAERRKSRDCAQLKSGKPPVSTIAREKERERERQSQQIQQSTWRACVGHGFKIKVVGTGQARCAIQTLSVPAIVAPH